MMDMQPINSRSGVVRAIRRHRYPPCCADSRHQWENFKKIPGLRMLNLKSQSMGDLDQLSFFADHVAQYHTREGPEKPWAWRTLLLEGTRNVIEVWAESKDEALRWAEEFNSHRQSNPIAGSRH